MPTLIIALYCFVGLLSLVMMGLSLYLVYKLYQDKGIGHAILGFFIFPYAYIWGWMNVKRLQIMDVMLTITFMMIISFVAPFILTALLATSSLQAAQSGSFIPTNGGNYEISFSGDDFESGEQTGTTLVSDDGDGNVSYSFTTGTPIVMGTIAKGQEVNANLEDSFDEHDWTFQGTSGQQITIQSQGTGDMEPEIKLIGPDGAWITSSEEGASPTIAHITNFTLPADGTYTIRLSAWGLDEGDYTLSLN